MRVCESFVTQPAEMEQVEMEQVRKRGLPPPLLGLDERGQAPLPDLFYSSVSQWKLVTTALQALLIQRARKAFYDTQILGLLCHKKTRCP
jgi:hypothetical protein